MSNSVRLVCTKYTPCEHPRPGTSGSGPSRRMLGGGFLTSPTRHADLPAWLNQLTGSADGCLLTYSGPNPAPVPAHE